MRFNFDFFLNDSAIINNILSLLLIEERYSVCICSKKGWDIFKRFEHCLDDQYLDLSKILLNKKDSSLSKLERYDDHYEHNRLYNIRLYHLTKGEILAISKKWTNINFSLDVAASKIYRIDFEDLTPFRYIKKLVLTGCNIYDYSALGGQYELDLSYTDIKDISNLKDVKILNLNYCYGIKDFSCLGKQKQLFLSDTCIKDLSNLVDIEHLDLSHCSYVTDFSPLGKQNCLDLKNTEIVHIDNLKNVKYLNLQSCFNIYDFSSLGKQYSLDISYTNIKDVSNLKNIKSLNIYQCSKIRNKELLRQLNKNVEYYY